MLEFLLLPLYCSRDIESSPISFGDFFPSFRLDESSRDRCRKTCALNRTVPQTPALIPEDATTSKYDQGK